MQGLETWRERWTAPMLVAIQLMWMCPAGIPALQAQGSAQDAARIFAPGVISTGRDFTVTFAPGGRELYFTRYDTLTKTSHILRSTLSPEGWMEPTEMPFAQERWADVDPALSPDGSRLYFASTRPRPSQAPQASGKNMDLWFVERTKTGWGEPRWIEGVNSDGKDGTPTVDRRGTLCFFSDRGRPADDNRIYCADRDGSGWRPPQPVEGGVNGDSASTSPWLSPDGSFILFYSTRAGGAGGADVYMSRKVDGGWTAAINLGPKVNTQDWEYNPSVSPDGSTLYFGRSRNIWMIPMVELGLPKSPP